MYKVFLVDDEIVIREGLRNSFQWEEHGFTLVGEAPDGEIALPMIRDEKPDILITDIRMPFMDGIDLCREVRKVMPWIQIVILSGYDNFEYAKQAISLGVQEYLLKPISANDLNEVLQRLRERIEKEQEERRDLEKLRSQITTGRLLVRDQVIGNVLLNRLTQSEGEKICAQMRSLGIHLISPCYTVIEFRGSDGQNKYTDMHAALMQLVESCCETVFLYSCDIMLSALVLGDNEKDIEERAYSFARSALDELDRSGYPDVRASIGETVTKFWELSDAYKSARHIRHTFENTDQPLRTRRIIGARDTQLLKKRDAAAVGIQPLYEHMKYADLEDFKEHFMTYVQSLKSINTLIPLDTAYLNTEVLLTAFRIIQEASGDPQQLMDAKWLEGDSASAEEIDRAVSRGLTILHRAIKFRDSKEQMKGNPTINKARQYLDAHFTEPGLTFQDVVDHVAMSASHFSTVFSQTTGFTFTQYLINLRLSKARELLYNTDMRSSEIAYAVGFNDPHYFSYLFKKNTGITPSEFRSGLENAKNAPSADE